MITIYVQRDLRKESENKSIDNVEYIDFMESRDPFIRSQLVVYVDEDKFKVLKNRLPSPEQNEILPISDLTNVINMMIELYK